MAEIKFTHWQSSAIDNRGGALLVAAAAGSGKTKVLTERVMKRVCEKMNDIDEFLIITYTKAAASELKEKLAEELKSRQTRDDRRLRRQAGLLYKAEISTIHAFCASILRENAHILNLSPDFRVGDDNECAVLQEKALETVLERKYEKIGENKDFAALVDTMSAGRDDSQLCKIVLESYNKLRAHPYPDEWMQAQLRSWRDSGKTDGGPWGNLLLQEAKKSAEYWVRLMQDALQKINMHPSLEEYEVSFRATIESLEKMRKAAETGWDALTEFGKVDFPKLKAVRKKDGFGDEECAEYVKDVRERCKKSVLDILEKFEISTDGISEDMDAMSGAISELFTLISDFDVEYFIEKSRKNILDFSDLEHFALKLLIEDGKPTQTAEEISKRYTEIMVDEYQDVNRVQDMIFRAISKNERNLFMVGDVKQSIYRFRLADPSIFLEKYKSFKDYEEAEEDEPRRILLSDNFRSRAGILQAVNHIFENVMSEEFGEMEYGESEKLRCGGSFAENGENPVELDVLEYGEEDRLTAEAEFTAQRIWEIKNSGMQIDDKGKLRPVRYGDFAILLRSVKGKAGIFASALERRGIPVSLDISGDFFESVEVTVAMSLLKVIDNPHQDIPLISLLRSPIYGFTADELAQIRNADEDADFYSALEKCDSEKCRAFLSELEEYRILAQDLPTDKLIWYIYNKTGILAIFAAMPDGERRRERLMLLLDCACGFEDEGYRGLFAFLIYMQGMIRHGAEPVPTKVRSASDSVVICSIHKSKGLEYPVVVLADLVKRFNRQDASAPLLIHPLLGPGPKRLDLERGIEYSTVPRLAVSTQVIKETLAEELRVLYVAMTRAREKLIMLCAYKDAAKSLMSLCKNVNLPFEPKMLETVSGMADWIMLPALLKKEADIFWEKAGILPKYRADSESPWDMRIVSVPERAENMEVRSEEKHEVINLEKILDFVYPYENAKNLPAKITATELKGGFSQREAAEEAQHYPIIFDRPEFAVREGELTAAEKGTALHLAMQYINYEKCLDLSNIADEIKRLADMHILSEKQAASIQKERIYRFFKGELGKRVLAADKVTREFKFSLLVPAAEYYTDCGDEEILFQGVVDCFIEEKEELTVIDFKTDYVNQNNINEKTEFYKAQVLAYAQALERITGKKVKQRIIYFFWNQKEAEV